MHKMNEQQYPRLQLPTVKELTEGKGIERPSNVAAVDETFKKAPKTKGNWHVQTGWVSSSQQSRVGESRTTLAATAE
jgi:hypothetical protein